MIAIIRSKGQQLAWLSGLWKWIKEFISSRREEFISRAVSPTLTGINIIPEDYTPAKLTEHPGIGSHEEIEPMK